MMNFNYITILTLLIINILIHKISNAQEHNFKTISLAVGVSNYNEEDFRSLEIMFNSSLMYFRYRDDDSRFEILPLVNLSLGSLKQNEDFGFCSTLTSGIAIFTFNKNLILDAAGGFAILTDDQIGEHNFGGHLQFAAHTGIYYKLTHNVLAGYRFYHISDGGIYDGHGLNRHLLEIGYAF